MSDNVPGDAAGKKVAESADRVRTKSECSTASDDGNANMSIGKRQRTTSQTFLVTSSMAGASPPKFVSLEEIMQAANGMKDMALVHEIVVDRNFRLERYEPEENTLHRMVRDNMHKAFWDRLRSDFEKSPPEYNHALVLLDEVRQGLYDLLLPQHTKLRQQITEILDLELIKQQVEKGILDFHYYAQYVLSVMAKTCAPVRDDRIKELTEATDVVQIFKGILETLDLMALDMANFTIEISKPDIIAHSVELERKKFADYLAITPDGLEWTRKWLLKYLVAPTEKSPDMDHATYVRNLGKETYIKAVMELIDWDEKLPYPETFLLDVGRLQNIQMHTERLLIIGTVLLITITNVGPDLGTLASFKEAIKEHCGIIMQPYTKSSDLKELLPNLAMQVIKDVKEAQQEHNLPLLTESAEKTLTDLILEVEKPENRVRQLVDQRIRMFLQQIISSSTAAPQKFPSGLTAFQKELTAIAGQFLKIVSHNTTVFCIYYYDIIEAALPPPTA